MRAPVRAPGRAPVRTTTRPAGSARQLAGSTPLAFLIGATVLFALGPAVLKLLTERGGQLGLTTGGISFCNVLFVGNLCAGLVTLVSCRPRKIVGELTSLPRRTGLLLVLAALVSTLYPALLFTALERTTVTNVVLLSRFNGIAYLLLGFLFFRDRVRLPEIAGYGIIAVGVGVLVVANNDGPRIQTGDALVLGAAVFFALTEVVSRKVLPHVSIQTYVFFRNFVSAVIFFVAAIILFGPEHFMDAFMGDLWVLMVAYALFAIVTAQILWLHATRVVAPRTVANTQLLNPIFSIFFAFVLLNEVPMPMQWLVIAILAVGMIVPRLWPSAGPRATEMAMSIDTGLVGK